MPAPYVPVCPDVLAVPNVNIVHEYEGTNSVRASSMMLLTPYFQHAIRQIGCGFECRFTA